jgi:hypothetical protein
MSNPFTFIIPGVLVVLVTLCLGWAGTPSTPKANQEEPTELDPLRRELREVKRRAALEKGGAQ